MEQWRPVLGYESSYEVSSLGRVRSLPRVIVRRNGRPIPVKGGIRKLVRSANSLRVTLGKSDVRLVHHLVLEAFVGPRPEGAIGLHWNDDPTDNRVENLRWGTYSDNNHDRVRNGIHHNARKTHCKRGHEFTPENIYQNKRGVRACKLCARLRAATRRSTP